MSDNTTEATGSTQTESTGNTGQVTQETTQSNATNSIAQAIEAKIKASPVAEPTKSIEAGQEADNAPAFSPNFKFKVSGEEKEMDEWIRPVIKDAEIEKKIRKLYEDANGLEPIAKWRDKLQADNQDLSSKYSTLYNDVSEAMQAKHRGDLGTFFERTGVSDEQVAKYMLEKINRQQLPPEQQQIYNELDAKRRAEVFQARQLEETETKYREMASQAREWEVDQWLNKPDISSIVGRYDAANGKGAFKHFVAQQGVAHHAIYGEDPQVETVISTALKILGDAYRNQTVPQSIVQPNGEKTLPVIPNVSGKNVSPTHKNVRSVDDLRKIQREMNA